MKSSDICKKNANLVKSASKPLILEGYNDILSMELCRNKRLSFSPPRHSERSEESCFKIDEEGDGLEIRFVGDAEPYSGDCGSSPQ